MEKSRTDEVRAYDLIEKGAEHIRKGEFLEALSCLEKSYNIKKTSTCLSYLGYLVAQERGKIKEGLAMCEAALSVEPENPLFSLNLGRTLYKIGRKEEGIRIARKGLYYGINEDTEVWLSTVGRRRRPAFPFLPRRHFLNKHVGLLLQRLGFM